MTAHAGDVDVAEDVIFQKLILIDLVLAVEYLSAKDNVHRMKIAFK